MADTLDNTPLVNGEPIDLYDATGIAVGIQIEVQNIGSSDIFLYSQLAEPSLDDDGHQIIKRGEFMENDEGDAGAWAISANQDGLLNIKVAL